MASALKLIPLLACVAQISSASLQNGTVAAKGFVALRGAADASERPTLTNMTMPVAAIDCPKTHRDPALMELCLSHGGCAWSALSGCRDWSDETFCNQGKGTKQDWCLDVVVFHGGSDPYAVMCCWNYHNAACGAC
eukprot:CAMPEP_0198534640 /NCGR_PEP_ID=MMETSP1462-20131121/36556_1 /TAXON_ID=1333877 /ORGANISM="Brandtodinium nutriculum, Strain RCC3387" /LENGTH=135 /DNA_ID=CAMNT_0044264563 /DNA_START=89 /DNA_END=496 /DNA_ORIENTATION=-